MSRLRAERVADQIQRELAALIQRELRDPRIPPMTGISAVDLSADLSHATCYVSIYGDEAMRQAGLKALIHAGGFLRSELAKRIRLRISPELHFRLDDTILTGMAMNRKIDEALAQDAALRAAHPQVDETDESELPCG